MAVTFHRAHAWNLHPVDKPEVPFWTITSALYYWTYFSKNKMKRQNHHHLSNVYNFRFPSGDLIIQPEGPRLIIADSFQKAQWRQACASARAAHHLTPKGIVGADDDKRHQRVERQKTNSARPPRVTSSIVCNAVRLWILSTRTCSQARERKSRGEYGRKATKSTPASPACLDVREGRARRRPKRNSRKYRHKPESLRSIWKNYETNANKINNSSSSNSNDDNGDSTQDRTTAKGTIQCRTTRIKRHPPKSGQNQADSNQNRFR